MSRGIKINRTSYDTVSGERVDWLDRFADAIVEVSKQTTAVEAARDRNNSSIYDQISSLMYGVPSANAGKTVEGIVQEMQDRIGLKEYLKRVSDNQKADKIAQVQNPLFSRFDQDLKEKLVKFIDNKISTHRGQISIPAIQYDLLRTFQMSGVKAEDVNNDEVAKYINDVIIEVQRANPIYDNSTDVGKDVGLDEDDSDNQVFESFKM